MFNRIFKKRGDNMPVAVKEKPRVAKKKSLFKKMEVVSLESKELDAIGMKLTQAFSIRHKIIALREAAMEIIVKDFKKQKKTYPVSVSEEAELLLKRAYEREKSFLRVVGPAVATTLKMLDGIRKQVKDLKVEHQRPIMMMVKALEYAVYGLEEFVKQLEKRSNVEGRVMDYVVVDKRLTKQILKYLEKEHKKEMQLEKKLFKMAGKLKAMKSEYDEEYGFATAMKYFMPSATAAGGVVTALAKTSPDEGMIWAPIVYFASIIIFGIFALEIKYREEENSYQKNLKILAG